MNKELGEMEDYGVGDEDELLYWDDVGFLGAERRIDRVLMSLLFVGWGVGLLWVVAASPALALALLITRRG
jgi:hypothetical protein